MRIATFLFLFAWSVSGHPQNLVQNANFDDGLAGWSISPTTYTATLNTTDGLPTPPSAELIGSDFNEAPQPAFYSPCFTVDASKIYSFSANYKVIAGEMSIEFIAYPNVNCISGTTENMPSINVPQSNGWVTATASDFTFNETSVAAQLIFATCCASSGPSGADVLIDHVDFRVQGTTPVRLQSFGVE